MALDDIAGFSLRRKLGSGSAGTVWLVRDRASGRNAVLKRVPTTAITHPEEFRESLVILQRIDHPHLARLHEVRETGVEWLLFSQYVVAGTLSALLHRRGPLTDGELVTLLSPLAEALDYLHRSGLTHGGVTADNILFDADGRPVLTDAALHRSSPTQDLTSLAAVARQSGGDPAVYTPDLFADPRNLLTIATPIPVNLAFISDPTTPSTPPPLPKPAPTDDPVQRSRGPLTPRPQTQSPPPTESMSPPQPPLPKPVRPATKPTRRKAVLPRLTRRTSTPAPNPLARLTTGSPGAAISATETPGDAGTTTSAVWGGGLDQMAAGPSRAGRRRTRRRTWRRRRFRRTATTAAVDGGRRLGLGHPAYGVLGAVGLGAAVVLVLGLVTVGILDNPAGSAAAADRATPGASPSTTSPAATAPPPRPTTHAPRPTTHAPRNDAAKWTRMLQALDTQRAQAFWTLDLALLDTVYVPGSRPWAADRALLTSYRQHKVRVRGLHIRIDRTTVEHQTPTTVVLRTTDHLTAGQAITHTGTTTPLPPGTPTTRRITLTTTTTTPVPSWRISAVTTA
ncbi:protein kinase domain-containing protein [Kribbella swartbergensis]